MLDLVLVHWTAFKDPSVRAAIRSLKPISYQINNNVIRQWFIVLKTCCQIVGKFSMTFTSNGILEHLSNLNINQFVFLCNIDRLLLSLGAGWSHKDYTLGSTRSLCSLQFEDSCNFLKNLLLLLCSIKLSNKSTADFFDTLHVYIALTNGILGIPITMLSITLYNSVLA